MTLSDAVLGFIAESARQAGAAQPGTEEDLFQSGILDSFSVVDLVSLLEEEIHVKIPDGDVNAANFKSIAAIEHYLEARKN